MMEREKEGRRRKWRRVDKKGEEERKLIKDKEGREGIKKGN